MIGNLIGITEGADPTVNLKWVPWVEAGRPAILITKMPRLLIPMLTGKENIIIHCTITGMGQGLMEPNIDKEDKSLEAYHQLCKTFGKDRVVLRIDPIILDLEQENMEESILRLVKEAEGRVRISFMDQYDHVKARFLQSLELTLPWTTFHAPLSERLRVWTMLGKPEVCSEPRLSSIPCVSTVDCKILGVEPSLNRKGQRTLCNCLANKTELCIRPPKCT